MTESRKIFDPFLGVEVEISERLTDRLRGRYANGPTMPNGEPEFGWRQFPVPPVQIEAANEIDRLRNLVRGFAEIERLRLATDEGSLKARADRMHEIAREAQGRPVAGSVPFFELPTLN